MTVLDPISGKLVAIDPQAKPRDAHGTDLPDDARSQPRQDASVDCELEPRYGTRRREEPED